MRKETASSKFPMVDAGETLVEIAMKHTIEKILSFVSVVVDHGYGVFAMLDLSGSVAPETDSLYPADLSKSFGYRECNQSCIHSLIEVYSVASLDYLFDLVDAVIRSKDVVIHEDEVLSSIYCYIVDIHVGAYVAFFFRDNAPFALVGASSGEEAVCGMGVDVGIECVVRLKIVYFGRQLCCKRIACSAFFYFIGIDVVCVVGCVGKHFAHVDFVVASVNVIVPLDMVAAELVEPGYFHEGKVGIIVPVDI